MSKQNTTRCKPSWRSSMRQPAPLSASMAVSDGPGPVPPTYVLDAGDYRKPEELVSAGFPEFLGHDEIEPPTAPSRPAAIGGRRSAPAEWLTLPDHPLTARIVVNRLWQHHFGQGIVATTNDFGSMGDSPANPQLLDWLACELVNQGWSLKAIHRLMVLSATYQQSSAIDPTSVAHQQRLKADPGNKLLWHGRRVRLEARDGPRCAVCTVGAARHDDVWAQRLSAAAGGDPQ